MTEVLLADLTGLVSRSALPVAALGVACWVAARAYERRTTPRLLAAMLWTVAAVVLLELGLGSFAALTARNVLVGTWCVTLAIGAFGAWAAWRGDAGRTAILPADFRRPTLIGVLLGVLTAAAYAAVAVAGTLVPATGWDTLTYHLTDIFHFAGSRSVSVVPQPGYPFFYPKVGELVSTYAYLLAEPAEQAWRVIGLALVPLALIAGVATRAAGEALALRRGLPWLAPGVMLMPIVLAQPLEGNVDVAFAAFLLAAFAFSLLAAAEGRFAHLALASLAAGLALGTKLVMLFLGPALLLVLATPRAWAWLREPGHGRRAGRILLLLLALAAGCGFWLGRAFLATGNPFYPQNVSIGGLNIFSGPVGVGVTGQEWWFVPRRIEWLRYPFYETMFGANRYGSGSGFGPQLAAGLVATLIALPLALFRRRWLLVRALLVLPLTIALWYLLTHSKEPRYAIACGGYALVGLAVLAEWIGGGWRAAGTEEPPRRHRLPLALVHLAVGAALVFAAAGGVVNAAPQLDEVAARWRAGEWDPEDIYVLEYGSAGEGFNWFATLPQPMTLTPTRTTFIAPLYGWHGQHRVLFATLPDNTRLEMIDAPDIDSWAKWHRFLRRNEVDLVVTWRHWWEEEPELNAAERWILEHPERFALEADFGDRMAAWRFLPGDPAVEEAAGPSAVGGLADPAAWELEYSAGSTTSLDAVGDDLRLAATWETAANDWCDWRARFATEDWSSSAALSMTVTAEQQPALLFVYLKGPRGSGGARFRIDLRQWEGGSRELRLPLDRPEWTNEEFSLETIGEIHLVLDDYPDEVEGRAALTVGGFALRAR